MKLKYLFSLILFYSLIHVFYSAEYTWTGANSTFYDVAANWSSSGGGVPTSSDNITIPNGLSNYPIVRTSVSITDVTINAGAT